MAPHSSTLAWKIPWTEEPGRLQPLGSQESDMTERLHFHFSLSCIGEGNGNPLQGSCLENPRDGGAWWAAVYGVAQSRTVLTHTPSFLSWRVGLLGDSPVTCKSRGWGKCQIAHWRNACVCDMGEQETWAGAIDPQPTSSPAQSLHITGEVTWGVT